jgi:hypothetical protein
MDETDFLRAVKSGRYSGNERRRRYTPFRARNHSAEGQILDASAKGGKHSRDRSSDRSRSESKAGTEPVRPGPRINLRTIWPYTIPLLLLAVYCLNGTITIPLACTYFEGTRLTFSIPFHSILGVANNTISASFRRLTGGGPWRDLIVQYGKVVRLVDVSVVERDATLVWEAFGQHVRSKTEGLMWCTVCMENGAEMLKLLRTDKEILVSTAESLSHIPTCLFKRSSEGLT